MLSMADRSTGYQQAPAAAYKRLLTAFAWLIMLLVSDLPDILMDSFSLQEPEWLFAGKAAILFLFLGLCLLWRKIRPLWQYVFILLVFYLAFAFSEWFRNTGWWSGLFTDSKSSFTYSYAEAYLRDCGIALTVIACLWLIQKRRKRFFFTKGDLQAPIEQVRWLGIHRGESWRNFGWIFAVAAGAGVCIPAFFSVQPTPGMITRVVPLLPAAFLFAGVNAFNEEIYFRVSLLSTLQEIISKTNLLLISAVFFGLAHYLHGAPPGIAGFLMTGFLAWLLGKSILETKGIFWAWFIHFVPDAVIFVSYALLWVKN